MKEISIQISLLFIFVMITMAIISFKIGKIEGMIKQHNKMMIVGIETIGECIDRRG